MLLWTMFNCGQTPMYLSDYGARFREKCAYGLTCDGCAYAAYINGCYLMWVLYKLDVRVRCGKDV